MSVTAMLLFFGIGITGASALAAIAIYSAIEERKEKERQAHNDKASCH